MAKVTAPHPHMNPKAIADKTVLAPAAATAEAHTGKKIVTTVKGMMSKAKRNARSHVFSHA
jgi:hypothetical protein